MALDDDGDDKWASESGAPGDDMEVLGDIRWRIELNKLFVPLPWRLWLRGERSWELLRRFVFEDRANDPWRRSTGGTGGGWRTGLKSIQNQLSSKIQLKMTYFVFDEYLEDILDRYEELFNISIGSSGDRRSLEM